MQSNDICQPQLHETQEASTPQKVTHEHAHMGMHRHASTEWLLMDSNVASSPHTGIRALTAISGVAGIVCPGLHNHKLLARAWIMCLECTTKSADQHPWGRPVPPDARDSSVLYCHVQLNAEGRKEETQSKSKNREHLPTESRFTVNLQRREPL